MATLLFEIGCEELPASACREAEAQLPALVRTHLRVEPTRVFVGPRRLAFLVEGLPERTPDTWAYGPPTNVAFDETGKPTKAAEGFARKQGVSVAELGLRDGRLAALVPGRATQDVLPEALAGIATGLTFGKSMQWGPPLRFSRPVRWLCAKLDSETIPVNIVGVPSVGHTYGHRFTSDEVEFFDASAWLGYLRNADVEPDAAERRRQIVAALDELGEWHDPMRKLDEVVHLVESPAVIVGEFHERFLALPPRVVETAMQSHQRYFPLAGSRFAFVANGGHPEVVRAGNERVLEGRLEDASFTFDRDVKVGIEGLAAKLGSITFFAGAGSYADKAERIGRLVAALGGGEASREAARLAKADQAAELVREFPDLEGHIGAEYARLAGFPEAVCVAIEEHYLPDAAGGPLPSTEPGKVLAAADKLDTLAIAFELGHRPTGSRDPYGLRRAAIGLCRLAVEGKLHIPRTLLPGEVRDFVEERLEGLLDVSVEFVRAARATTSEVDLLGVADLARALARLDRATLARIREVYIRAARIVGDFADDQDVSIDWFSEDAERELLDALSSEPQFGSNDVYIAWTASLADPLERFFTDVLVMAEAGTVRANRLRLLRDVRDRVRRYMGDLAQIPG